VPGIRAIRGAVAGLTAVATENRVRLLGSREESPFHILGPPQTVEK
jgi:hypothetical protein